VPCPLDDRWGKRADNPIVVSVREGLLQCRHPADSSELLSMSVRVELFISRRQHSPLAACEAGFLPTGGV